MKKVTIRRTAMGVVTAKQLKQRTEEMIQRVKSGERLTLTYWGKPVAMIIPISETDAAGADSSSPPDEAWKGIEKALKESEPKSRDGRRRPIGSVTEINSFAPVHIRGLGIRHIFEFQ